MTSVRNMLPFILRKTKFKLIIGLVVVIYVKFKSNTKTKERLCKKFLPSFTFKNNDNNNDK